MQKIKQTPTKLDKYILVGMLENNKGNLHISVEVIKLGTDNFSDCKCIGEGRYWKQYAGEILHADKHITVVAKRWDNKSPQTRHQFLTELQILSQYKHENIISLVGYCNEGGERIIVYESASNGSLDKHLANASLSWIKRLKIFIDVAKGLEFLHTSVSRMHWGIKSASILLDGDWKAKISNLELSAQLSSMESIHDHITDDNAYVSKYDIELGFLTKESDIYSLGVVIKELFRGIPARLDSLHIYRYYYTGSLRHQDAFDGIEKQIDPKTFKTFADIAGRCLDDKAFNRPDATQVITELEKALEFQEDYEKWEPRLPVDYQKIIQMSKTPELYQSIEMRRDLYNMFLKGILLQDGNLFSIGTNGERNEMMPARRFSYGNRRSHKWRSADGSRFPKVAEITDISNLKIQIKMKKQFISPSVNHKVYLIFRVCGPRKSQAKRMYVNLKYKTGNETLHAYFATWREDGWMMIELFQSLNNKEDTDFEVLLESFSRCYCGSSSIYIEGIEFQAIDNNHEETKGFKEVQKVDLNAEKVKKQHIEEQEMTFSAKKDEYTFHSLRKRRIFYTPYRAFDKDFNDFVNHLRIPLKEIASATNNFADENVIARGSHAHVYKGALSDSSGDLISVVVRGCLKRKGGVIVNDLMMYKNLKHKNIISLFKFKDTHGETYTIHKYESNESLDKHLTTLSWMQRLQICAGVAHALRYLHFGLKDDYSVIHGNIKTSKILLDHNWEPKLHDFRCSVKVKRGQPVRTDILARYSIRTQHLKAPEA
ncbi:hypothetical protein R6Q59_024766 [Mikania micrantha]